MNLEYAPLLQAQRDLYKLPRGMDRFREYLKTMIDAETGDLQLPLVAMNPMGKDHLPPFLDKPLKMDAEHVAAAAAEAARALQTEPGQYKACLVVSDYLLGGWTNRYASEFGYRFEQKPYSRRGWIAGLLWTSETYTPARVGGGASVHLPRRLHRAPRLCAHARRNAGPGGICHAHGQFHGPGARSRRFGVHS